MECLGDLQGPKFRVGELAGEPIPLKDGDILEFGIGKAGPIWGIKIWQGRLAIARFRFRLYNSGNCHSCLGLNIGG